MTDPNTVSLTPTAKEIRDALKHAFSLGWQIVELQSRLKVKVSNTSDDRGLRLTGIWHSAFCKIATITNDAFPDGTTANTLFEPAPREKLPYLFPAVVSPPATVTTGDATAVVPVQAPLFDYANVGIGAVLQENSEQKQIPILAGFRLYEVTRRSINCLTLLSTREEDSLIPDSIKTSKQDLLTRLRPFLPQTAKSEEERAQEFLTSQTVRFLEAWHGYLRQNYYVGRQVSTNNIELVAYEAGHAMSALSWELLVATLDLETASSENAARSIEDAWNSKFTDQAIIHLQHQVSALSCALDAAHFQDHPEQKAPDPTASLAIPNPDLPSQSIQAIKNSLDYWIAAVKWVAQHKEHFHSTDERAWRKSLRIALTEQTNVWQNLISGQESLRGYNVETAAHKIMQDITEEIGDGLRQGFREAVRQTEEMLKEAQKEATAAIGSVFESGRSVCWILLAVGILIAAAGAMGQSIGLPGVLSGLGSLLFGGYKWLGLNSLKNDAEQKIEKTSNPVVATSGSNVLSQMEGTVQDAEAAVLKAFQRGYEQMRIELDSLNRSIAVTYPLVEFFGKELRLDSDVDFLTDIFWDGTKREEEIKRVIWAAFGGLALIVEPKSVDTTSV
jgi:hypothetical protein